MKSVNNEYITENMNNLFRQTTFTKLIHKQSFIWQYNKAWNGFRFNVFGFFKKYCSNFLNIPYDEVGSNV